MAQVLGGLVLACISTQLLNREEFSCQDCIPLDFARDIFDRTARAVAATASVPRHGKNSTCRRHMVLWSLQDGTVSISASILLECLSVTQ